MKTTNITSRKVERYILILLCAFISIALHGQSEHELLRNGDASYSAGEYSKAEEAYRKAIDKEGKSQAKYNLGNSLYEQERFDEALEQYQAAINAAPNDKTKSQAYHNLGNSLFNNEKLKESLEAYKQALRYNPDDLETKHNLSYAKQMLRQQQQQQQQEQEQQEGEESDEEQENQEEQQQEGEQQEDQEQKEQENQEQKESEEQQDIDNQNDQQEPSEDKQDLDKEDARKLLEIAENEEKKVQEKMRKVSGGKKRKKDW